MQIWIDIEFTKLLGQFKQKEICRSFHNVQFQVLKKKPFKFNFVNYNTTLLIKIFLYFDYKS